MTIAYSYVRFSTADQAQGDSIRRQREMAAAYAAKRGLVLDESYKDEGLSAHRGKHVARGAFGRFVQAVKEERIPKGSVLLIERFDRFSREEARRAWRLLDDLLEADIEVVTLDDGKSYTKQSVDAGMVEMITIVVAMYAACKFSKDLQDRLLSAWSGKRAATGGRKLTGRVPGWLEPVIDHERSIPGRAPFIKEFIPHPERAPIVQRIFEMCCDEGMGKMAIAARLNDEGVPTWAGADGWRASFIRKILTNPAVIGVYHPHVVSFEMVTNERTGQQGEVRRRKPTGEVRADYYPAVVSRELWDRAQAKLKKDIGTGGRKDGFVGLFPALMTCQHCGGRIVQVFKGPGGKRRGLPRASVSTKYGEVRHAIHEGRFLACDNALRRVPAEGGMGPKCRVRDHMALGPMEGVLLYALRNLLADGRDGAGAEVPAAVAALEARAGSLRDGLAKKRAKLAGAVLALGDDGADAETRSAFDAVRAEIEADKAALSKLERDAAAARGSVAPARDVLQVLGELHEAALDPDPAVNRPARVKIGGALRGVLDGIVVDTAADHALVGVGGWARHYEVEKGTVRFRPLDEERIKAVALLHPEGSPERARLAAMLRREVGAHLAGMEDDEAAMAEEDAMWREIEAAQQQEERPKGEAPKRRRGKKRPPEPVAAE